MKPTHQTSPATTKEPSAQIEVSAHMPASYTHNRGLHLGSNERRSRLREAAKLETDLALFA